MFRHRILALGIVAFLAACGGGGGSSSGPVSTPIVPTAPIVAPTATAPPPAGSAAARFVLKIPAKAGTSFARTTKYVAPGTAAIRFTLLTVNGSPTGNAPGSITALDSTVCTTNADGSKTCTLNVSAPVGSDNFSVETFADAAGTQKVGSGIVNVQVALNTTNTAGMTLGGALDHVALQTTTTYFGDSYYYYYSSYSSNHRLVREKRPVKGARSTQSLATTRLYVIAFDAQNNVIIDPTPFSVPITVGVSEPDAIQLSVTHGDGTSGGSTTVAPTPSPGATASPLPSTSWPTVTLTATTDVLNATLVSGWMNPWTVQPYYSQYQAWPVIAEIRAWIGSPSTVSAPPSFSQYYSPQSNAGQQINAFYPYQLYTVNVTNTTSPPAPCAPGYVLTSSSYVSCGSPAVILSTTDATTSARFSGGYGYGYYSFTGPNDGIDAAFSASSNDVTFSGSYTATANSGNAATCPTVTATSSSTFTIHQSGGGTYYYCNYTIANSEATAALQVYQNTPQLQWSATPSRIYPSGYSTGRVEFAYLTDPTVVTVSFTSTDAHAPTTAGSGGPTFQPDPSAGSTNAANCANAFTFADTHGASQPIGSTGWTPAAPTTTNASYSAWAFNVKINTATPPTSGTSCKIIVSSSGGSATTYDGLPASLEFDVNNLVGGTIQ